MIYSWQTVNTGNLAEQVCRPSEYFDLGDVAVLPDESREMPLDAPIIFGGSGLLYPEIAGILEATVKASRFPCIAWGIGVNTHYGDAVDWPNWLQQFALVGLRDWHSPYAYVPCPSCMHPAFDAYRDEKPKHTLVIYDQFDYPVGMEIEGVSRVNNYKPQSAMEDVVEFLASGETILTSSYHGAYWGFLLNRRVLIWKPWSTKFLCFKPRCFYVDETNFKLMMTVPQDNTGYLEECRSINTEFSRQVRRMLCQDACLEQRAGVKSNL